MTMKPIRFIICLSYRQYGVCIRKISYDTWYGERGETIMGFQTHLFTASEHSCWACVPKYAGKGERLPLMILPGEAEGSDTLSEILKTAQGDIQTGKSRPFVLAGFASDDWNRDFTPWSAPALSKKSAPFAGKGNETLAWMLGPFLSELEAIVPVSCDRADRCILGYSLAGLFALWGFYESGLFGACASCSGSLWYDGWTDYTLRKEISPQSRVYLSLGRSEEKARNPRMGAVGAVTRGYADRLHSDKNVADTALVWHDGGHFQDIPKRLSAAVSWLSHTKLS